MNKFIPVVMLLSVIVAACEGSGFTPAPVNAAPTIASIVDQNTSANATSSVIALTVTDDDPVGLSFAVSSDNQLVVPDAGIILTTKSGGGSITVTPVIDTLGNAFITIVVTDQSGLSATTSFLLTVIPEQASLQQFVRAEFTKAEDGMPALINAVAFDQDAENDDYADLLAQ